MFRCTCGRELLLLGPTLPPSWVVKPVGAAMYEGISVVVDGYDMWAQTPVNLKRIVSRLRALKNRGGKKNAFNTIMEWNLSSFLIEELVICESGIRIPVDYRVFVLGDRCLWIWINWYNSEAHATFHAFVDTAYTMLPPGNDPMSLPVPSLTISTSTPMSLSYAHQPFMNVQLQHNPHYLPWLTYGDPYPTR